VIDTSVVKKTIFYDSHVAAGGNMVPFAGYLMPVNYSEGIIKEHLHTRNNAGLFDVSHMGQILIKGKKAVSALETLVPADLDALEINQQLYSVFTSSDGGVLDDLIITRWAEDCFFLVVNAACKDQDIEHLKRHLTACDISFIPSQSLIALQGLRAVEIISELAPEAANLQFMHGCCSDINGIACYITRSGYTGEDGFEISVADECALELSAHLLAYDYCQWIGLGARDSLRLEAGLCLYGHDMDKNTSPIEARIGWSIGISRRAGGAKEGGFLGSAPILQHLSHGIKKQRVGFVIDGRSPVREGADITDSSGEIVGKMTSGGFGPTLQVPIAMGYVSIDHSEEGSHLNAIVRGKPRPITVTRMPFVKHRYYRG
jgi:aminomethyltransferase